MSEPQPQPGCIRKLFLQAKASIVSLTGPGYLGSLVEREFHALVTFLVVFLLQMVYLQFLLSGGSFSEKSFLTRYAVHLHIAALLIGGAIVRCLIGYLITGQHVHGGNTFDYPNEVNGNPAAGSELSKSDKTNNDKTD